ncbi:MAG: hypothetical protein LBI26_02360 [Holosporales bacterium]|nr:hypothetical protein [Holosporales bacterium]
MFLMGDNVSASSDKGEVGDCSTSSLKSSSSMGGSVPDLSKRKRDRGYTSSLDSSSQEDLRRTDRKESDYIPVDQDPDVVYAYMQERLNLTDKLKKKLASRERELALLKKELAVEKRKHSSKERRSSKK